MAQVWEGCTASATATMKLYMAELVPRMIAALQSSSWPVKVRAHTPQHMLVSCKSDIGDHEAPHGGAGASHDRRAPILQLARQGVCAHLSTYKL
eukprot:484216-Prorocentrum_minimum.AAC.1